MKSVRKGSSTSTRIPFFFCLSISFFFRFFSPLSFFFFNLFFVCACFSFFFFFLTQCNTARNYLALSYDSQMKNIVLSLFLFFSFFFYFFFLIFLARHEKSSTRILTRFSIVQISVSLFVYLFIYSSSSYFFFLSLSLLLPLTNVSFHIVERYY